jgi:small subunit ribosomal protein S2
VGKEHIAVKEAKRLGIPVFAMVDTNSDPDSADFPIPANDDAFKSIAVVTQIIGQAIEEGLMERKRERDEEKEKEGADAKANEDMNSDGGATAPATIAEALAPAPAKTGRTRIGAEAPAAAPVAEEAPAADDEAAEA